MTKRPVLLAVAACAMPGLLLSALHAAPGRSMQAGRPMMGAPMGSPPEGPPPGGPPPQRFRADQDAARRALLDGNIMPFSVLKRRVEKQIGDNADYLGSEFLPDRNSYRLKYMRDRNVLWVDVDGRTGDITGWAR